mmetsp:Transcript_84367/g.243507  ORF Transcript_84367/g.243507 Transcript_84367/m.243507 type:complete len:542 (+) Transcript_84367:78-1703(+)
MGLCGHKSSVHDPYKLSDTSSQSSPRSPPPPRSSGGGNVPVHDGMHSSDTEFSEGGRRRPSQVSVTGMATETAKRRMRLITETWGNINDLYGMDSGKLGEGSFGYVCKATSRETGVVRAVKVMSKSRTRDTRKRYRQEAAIMKLTDHPNIIKLFETFEDKQNLHLVLELCMGGDLHTRLQSMRHFPEHDAVELMKQVLRPVFYLHDKHLCHRDLKPENFLFLTPPGPINESLLKLADFGFARLVKRGQAMTTKLGTPRYSSPQVLAGQYGESCDVWSCGVIMFVLLSGMQPFDGKSDAEVMQRVRRGNYAFKGATWDAISDGAKDTIRSMLTYKEEDRATAEQVLQRMSPRNAAGDPGAQLNLTPNLLLNLQHFCSQSLFRRAALQVVAQHLRAEDSAYLRNAFMSLDSRGAGSISIRELRDQISYWGITASRPDLAQAMEDLHIEGDAEISFTDFLAATLSPQHYTQEGACSAAFRAFDRRGQNRITISDLWAVLYDSDGNEEQYRHAQELLDSVDTNRDGAIDFVEFRQMLAGETPVVH